jgi:hypothetical protein
MMDLVCDPYKHRANVRANDQFIKRLVEPMFCRKMPPLASADDNPGTYHPTA